MGLDGVPDTMLAAQVVEVLPRTQNVLNKKPQLTYLPTTV